MAVILGFVVVFAAGIAGAYFVGVAAARSTGPSFPAPTGDKKTGEVAAKPAPRAYVASAAAASSGTTAADAPVISDPELAASTHGDNEEAEVSQELIDNTRRFQRFAFSGTAVATIYPYPESLRSSREPVRCEVLTRDLCRNGIGIAHSECLVPHQMIVIDAVGKLLVGEVRWCQRVDKNLYVAGCRLIKTITN